MELAIRISTALILFMMIRFVLWATDFQPIVRWNNQLEYAQDWADRNR